MVFLQHLGYHLKFLDFGEHKQFDKTQIYETFRVCKSCNALFKQIEELKKVQIQLTTALGMNVDVEEHGRSDSSRRFLSQRV